MHRFSFVFDGFAENFFDLAVRQVDVGVPANRQHQDILFTLAEVARQPSLDGSKSIKGFQPIKRIVVFWFHDHLTGLGFMCQTI